MLKSPQKRSAPSIPILLIPPIPLILSPLLRAERRHRLRWAGGWRAGRSGLGRAAGARGILGGREFGEALAGPADEAGVEALDQRAGVAAVGAQAARRLVRRGCVVFADGGQGLLEEAEIA